MASAIYPATIAASHPKYTAGSGARPRASPTGVKGIHVAIPMPASDRSATGAEARLCTKGRWGVRIVWITSIWLHMDSTNHPAWKREAKSACPSCPAIRENSCPPVHAGQITKYSTAKVTMSNTELTGPFQSINRLIPEASHFLGTRSQSSSTLSQDMAVQEMS